jgi:hypothetical protein
MRRYGPGLVVALSVLFSACGGSGGGGLPPVTTNEAPTVTVTGPGNDVESAQGAPTVVTVNYTDADPDSAATTDLIADRDGDLATTGDQVVIATGRPDQNGTPQSVPWVLSGVTPGTYKIFARTSDGTTTVVGSASGLVLVNAAPTLTITNLSADVTVSRGAVVQIRYTDNDADDTAMTWLFADRDGNRDTTGDSYLIAAARPENIGVPQTVLWDTTGVEFGYYNIMGQTWDGTNAPVLRTATGRVDIVNASFASSAGGLGTDVGEDVATFPDGSSVVVGHFNDDATFGLGEANETALVNAGFTDAFVARFLPNGLLEWALSVGNTGFDEAYGVVAFGDGSCIVTGTYEGAVVFGSGEANQTTLTALGGGGDLFLARYNADGTLAWAKRAGGTGSFVVGFAIAAYADGSVVVTGAYSGDVIFGPGEGGATTLLWNDFSDVFVARFNATGTLAWAKRGTSGGTENALGVATFADGTCVVTGHFNGDITFGEAETNVTTLFPFGLQEVFVARFGSTGLLQWAVQAGGFEGEASGMDVATFADGTCVVSGWFTEFMDFGFLEPNETNFLAFGERDAFVARFNVTGQLAWAVQQGGTGFDSAQGIEPLSDGSCVLTGFFDGAAFFGLGDHNETLLFSISPRDLYVARIDASGALSWVQQAGGTSTQCVPHAMALFADGSFGVTGWFDDGGVFFGEGGNLAWPVASVGLEDVFLARYNADGGF